MLKLTFFFNLKQLLAVNKEVEEAIEIEEAARLNRIYSQSKIVESQHNALPQANYKPFIKTSTPGSQQHALVQKKISENDLKIIRAFTNSTHNIPVPPADSKAQQVRRRVNLGNIYSQFNSNLKRDENKKQPLTTLAQSSPIFNISSTAQNNFLAKSNKASTSITDTRFINSTENFGNDMGKKSTNRAYKARNSYAMNKTSSVASENIENSNNGFFKLNCSL
jgi:hypothetical protein